jgi:hypothetical protein
VTQAPQPPLVWKKSSYSAQSDCVETAIDTDRVLVRDSKDPDGVRLAVPRAAWTAFLGSLRSGGPGR